MSDWRRRRGGWGSGGGGFRWPLIRHSSTHRQLAIGGGLFLLSFFHLFLLLATLPPSLFLYRLSWGQNWISKGNVSRSVHVDIGHSGHYLHSAIAHSVCSLAPVQITPQVQQQLKHLRFICGLEGLTGMMMTCSDMWHRVTFSWVNRVIVSSQAFFQYFYGV